MADARMGCATDVLVSRQVPAPDGSGAVDDHGVHAFVVPMRDASKKLCPGVEIKDCGYKVRSTAVVEHTPTPYNSGGFTELGCLMYIHVIAAEDRFVWEVNLAHARFICTECFATLESNGDPIIAQHSTSHAHAQMLH